MDEFIKQLLQDQGIPSDLDDDVYQQLVSDVTASAVDFINRKLIEAMPDDAVTSFNDLLESPDADAAKVQAFVETHVPDKEQVTTKALLDFRALYLGDKNEAV